MPNTYYLILLAMLLCITALAGCLYLLKKSMGIIIKEPAKDVPVEAGSLPQKPAWVRFHVHYYGFALLFLAFDMEMAFMYPWAVVYKELGITALIDMGVFLMILFLGLLYTWSQGGLKRQ
ncbi:NADH-quinone oxidoreductase subunit A [Spirosoma luteum]|uniref:NADH-quinone oxidoreductase subunit A n=1 Tax=Spirosoma luteum TaxID=431553 RepID=UPI0003A50D1B|nr:NADH-quinone oxidoreductase subunit A [Spirosoma luteum]